MRYSGGHSGSGVLKCDGEEIARVSYEFDGFHTEPDGVMRSGELRINAEALKGVIGCKDVQLLTDDGRVFDLKFSDRATRPADDADDVDAEDADAEDAPELAEASSKWRH